MSQVNSNSTNTLLRIDTSRVNTYLGPEPVKMNFGQKLSLGLRKAVSFLAPIAGAVTAVVAPGIGIPIAMGCYGLGKLAGDSANATIMKHNIDIQNQQAQFSQMPVGMPGLFEQDTPSLQATSFIAPSQYDAQITGTVIDREASRGSAVSGF